MIRLKYEYTQKNLLHKYQAKSFKINFTQRYGDKEKIVKNMKLFWERQLRTISHN